MAIFNKSGKKPSSKDAFIIMVIGSTKMLEKVFIKLVGMLLGPVDLDAFISLIIHSISQVSTACKNILASLGLCR